MIRSMTQGALAIALSRSSTTTSRSNAVAGTVLDRITPDQVVELGDHMRQLNVPLSEFISRFAVHSVGHLPSCECQDAHDWIDAQCVIGQA